MSEEQSTPSFLQRDPNNRAILHCSHPEATGTFTMRKLTFARELERERIKGIQAGPSPTPDGLVLADWYATIAVGFKATPDSFKLDEIEDEALVSGLWSEVTAYWSSFRRAEQS